MRRPVLAAALAIAVALATAPTASAVPDCATPQPGPLPVLSGQGTLESVVVDARGRLFYTDQTAAALMRLDRPGAPPVRVAAVQAPGGLALDADGRHLFVGTGDSIQGGLLGNVAASAQLLRIDGDTGAVETFATGLRMANGVTRAADGTLFTSSDLGFGVERISPAGVVQPNWAAVFSGNGLAIDAAQRFLFVNQTFAPAAVVRVPLSDPSSPETYFRASGADLTAGLDGMTIDPQDRLIVAANLSGEVWRVGTDGAACALGRKLTNASAVAYGRGDTGFSEGRLFSVGFDGVVAELPAGRLAAVAAPTPKPPKATPAITLLPRSARVVGGRVRVVLHVRRGKHFVRATRVRAGRVPLRTGRRVTVRVSPSATLLVVTFRVGGKAYRRTVRLVR